MKFKYLLLLAACVLAFVSPAFSQVGTKTGSIYGKVVDDKGAPLPGVSVTLESSLIPTQTATTGPSGGFRFANLPPGAYSATFTLQGFTEVRQEDVRVNTGSQVQLEIPLKASPTEQVVVTAEAPAVDKTQTGNQATFSREYLDKVPNGRDPWVILDQTPGVDNDRYNVAGSESGQQTGFFARGGNSTNNEWNYDGVNAGDPVALGATPTYYDFDAFQEIQIASGGNDASIGTSGVVVNIVTKRAGNKWEGNGSYYFVNDKLQADNTPEEVIQEGQLAPDGTPLIKSNRIDQVYDVGFDVGGPVIKDKFFAWGAYRRNQINLFTRTGLTDRTKLTDYNFKANFNWNSANESQFGYFNGLKDKSGRGFDPPHQASETLWEQSNTGTITPGIWTGQHTWIPNDHTIVTGRYGYIGLPFSLIPRGGNDKPIIYLAALPLYTNTGFFTSPIDRQGNDFNADVNYYKENLLGGDHEFKFGFEFKRSKAHTFSSYGNGLYITEDNQTDPSGPLTSGTIKVQHFIDGHVQYDRTSFYATDTFRKDRLTLNLGFRVDSQNGKNQASSIPSIVGFESLIGPLDFPGNDRTPTLTDVSPRVGGTFDVTGDGKTLVRANYARYYDGYNPFYDTYNNPTYVYNGFTANFANLNGDRNVTINEIDPATISYYGGLSSVNFDLDAFEAKRKYSADFHNQHSDEFIVGFEREVFKDLSAAVTFTHRKYDQFINDSPFGVTAASYVPGGVFNFPDTPLGAFLIPFDVLATPQDGTHILENVQGYTNTYNGVDIALRKRMSNNFLLNGALTLQRQKAHYDTGADSRAFLITTGDGFVGRFVEPDPSQLGLYNDQPYAYVSGGSGKSGVFPYAEWTLRMSGVYQLPRQFSAGAFVRYQQGYPYVLFGSISDGSFSAFDGFARLLLLEPIGSRRYDNVFTLDLNVQKVIDTGSYGRLTLAADLFNVTNANTINQRNRRLSGSQLTPTGFNAVAENLSPRALRLGIKYSF